MILNNLYSILNRINTRTVSFPLKDINKVVLRPSEREGERLYALPLCESLSENFDLRVLLPEDYNDSFFKKQKLSIRRYPEKLNFIRIRALKDFINDRTIDLFIDLSINNLEIFSYIVNARVNASIYEGRGINILAWSKSESIVKKYSHLMKILNVPVEWEREPAGMKKWDVDNNITGITSDIGRYPGFQTVNKYDDLYRISYLISTRNDISTVAYLLGVPQTIILNENDDFHPPESIKVIRYSGKITSETIEKCLP